MKFFIIFLAIYFIHNSFAQIPPQVTIRNHQQRHGHSHNQENDLSVNSMLNALRLQLEKIEYSNTQIVNAVKNYRYEMDELKKSLNKVQGEVRFVAEREEKKISLWWQFCTYHLKNLKYKN